MHFLGEGVEISRIWATAHFLVSDGQPWNCYGASLCHLYRGLDLVKVDLSAILDPLSCNQFTLYPPDTSFFQRLCPAPLPLISVSSYRWITEPRGFPGGSVVRICLPMQETWVRSLDQEDPLESEMTTHSQYSCLEKSMDRGYSH